MADELHTPNHRWYQGRYHIPLAKEDHSKQWIFDSGIQKIDAWIALLSGVSAYAVLGFEPQLVFDFDDEYYRKGGSTSTFDNAMTHTRASHATMVDSDGLLKWAPHNLMLRSEDFDTSPWGKSAATGSIVPVITADAGTAPDGTMTADRVQFDLDVGTRSIITQNISTGLVRVTAGVWAKSFDGTEQKLVISFSGVSPIEFTVGASWVFLENPWLSNISTPQIRIGLQDGQSSVQTCDVLLWGAHLYRSDLGGMVDNADRGDSYVPTTSAIRYLSRRGHHVYNGTAWANEGLLHESEARTNRIPYSENFAATGGSGWASSSTGTIAINATGPDGETSAVTLVDGGTGGSGQVYLERSSQAVTVGVPNTFSVFAKKDQVNFLALSTFAYTVPSGSTYFDLDTGVVSSQAAAHSGATIEDYGNGWYRCSITFTADAADSLGIFRIHVAETSGNLSVPRDGTSSILVFGAQVEAGIFPSSYIPTAGTPGTRAAETITVPAANLPYSATAMSIQMDGRITYAKGQSPRIIFPWLWQEDIQNRIYPYLDSDPSISDWFFLQEALDVLDSVRTVSAPTPEGILVPYNIAGRHGSTFINGAVDGVSLTENTTPTALPDLSATDLNLGFDYMGTIRQFRMWNADLGDAGIAEASA